MTPEQFSNDYSLAIRVRPATLPRLVILRHVESITVSDRVKVYLDPLKIRGGRLVRRMVFRIDPYSNHRRFYWVQLDADAQAILGSGRSQSSTPKEYPRNSDDAFFHP